MISQPHYSPDLYLHKSFMIKCMQSCVVYILYENLIQKRSETVKREPGGKRRTKPQPGWHKIAGTDCADKQLYNFNYIIKMFYKWPLCPRIMLFTRLPTKYITLHWEG